MNSLKGNTNGELLYKLDSKGKVRIWWIYVQEYSAGHADIVMESGLEGGKLVVNSIRITEGKNIGKANETTPFEQAVKEAQAKVELQLRSGYVRDKADLKQFTLGSGIPAPMLAQKYSPDGSQKGSKTLAKMKIEGEIIHVQPKYDGNRCLMKLTPDGVELYTRKGDRMLPIPHLEEQIFASYQLMNNNSLGISLDGLILDGELFTDKFSFNTLNGLLRKEDKTEQQQEMLRQIDYRLYDVMTDEGYEERQRLIRAFRSQNVDVVPTYEIRATDDEIKKYLEKFLSEGHEGLMIRVLGKGYENKRSWQLVKCKLFEDEEFELSDIEEDARGGFVGAFIMKMNEPSVDRDGKPITEFKAGVSGLSQEEGAEMLKNKANYIGRIATVEFFGRSEYGVPRFPKLKGFRSDV